MIQFTPTADNLYDLESDIDFHQIIITADRLIEENEVSQACQMRLDASMLIIEAIDKLEDELELNMQNIDNQSVVELLFNSGLDHYMISDFEMAIVMLETALELDPEDHYGATITSAFCYAGLNEWDAVNECIKSFAISKDEELFLTAFSNAVQSRKFNLSTDLKNKLIDEDSDLYHQTFPLKNSFPQILSQLSL